MDLEAHLRALARLLDVEREEEKRRFAEARASLSAEQREALGMALTSLKSVDTRSLAGRVVLELGPTRPGAELAGQKLSVGALVRVVPRRPFDDAEDEPPTGVVSRRSRTRISIAFDAPPPDWAESEAVNLELLPSEVTYERLKAGLTRLRTREDKPHARWRALLSGEKAPSFDPRLPFSPSPDLNPEQNEALQLALAAEDFALVHGPPGTGKTTVLAELIVRAVQRGEKVLVAAASNTAVDNVLERVAGSVRALRLGHVARVSEELLAYTLDEQVQASFNSQAAKELLDEAHGLLKRADKQVARGRSSDRFRNAREARREASRMFAEARTLMRGVRSQLVADAQVVCATCTGVESALLSDVQFDLAVVDEATQASEPAALLPLMRAKKVVLAGDHKQLPPTVLSPQAAREGLSRSLFERLLEQAGPSVAKMLREQYRMHEAVMRFPSDELYGGELRAHPSVAHHLLSGLPGVDAAQAPPVALHFLDTAGKGFDDETGEATESQRNPGEAKLVLREVEKLLAAGVKPEQIAVIAPYDAQVQTLRALMHDEKLEIDTVDGFQGREREAVIVSLTRSNANAEVGFLADIRRMNVAVTRARRYLLVVGDSATVSSHPFYADFIEYVTRSGGYRSAWDEPD